MSVMPMLDIAIGLSFIYLLLSLICTSLNEVIAGWLHTRGKTMARGIERLLGDPELAKALYKHPLIRKLASNEEQPLPSYIPADKFALALMDIVTGKEKATSDGAALRASTSKYSEDFQQSFTAVLQSSSSPALINDQQKIEAWFNDQMDRVSGWYKKNTQVRVFIIAIVVTLAFNADTGKIAKTLWTHPAVTASVVEAAKDRVAKGRPEDEAQPMVEYENPNDPTKSNAIHLPPSNTLDDRDREILGELTGWKGDWVTEWKKAEDKKQNDLKMAEQAGPKTVNTEELHATTGDWFVFILFTRVPGWLVTIFALSLGAPFWFDMLNRFMNIRNAGRAPDEPRDKSTTPTAPAGAK